MSRHHPVLRPADRPHQIFYSPGGRRGLAIVVLLGLMVVGLTAAAAYTHQVVAAPPQVVARNGETDFPRRLTDSLKGRPIPLIGDGVLRRVVEIHVAEGQAYAVDPFSSRVYRRLTRLERRLVEGSRYAVDQYGAPKPKTIALTFDDGPDPTWTPQLLDILAAYHVRATFFVIGSEVVRHPELLQRIEREGHLIGNHSLTHPELNRLSDAQARRELVMTSRILAADDYQTPFFRLPYGGSDPDSIRKSLRGTLTAQQLGLADVGFTHDTDDFEYKPGAAIPLPRLSGKGEVIVMHDGGGNRQSTLQLVIKIIQSAQAQDYRFVAVDQLPGVSVSSTSPHQGAGVADILAYRSLWSRLVLPGLMLGSFLEWATRLISGMVVLTILAAFYARLVYYRRWGRRTRATAPLFRPRLVSCLIAASNEEAVIRRTVETIFRYDYPFELEVVIVNDGSTDRTGEILDELAAVYSRLPKRLVVAHVPNGGKGNALNHAILGGLISGQVFVAIDADTVVDQHTLPRLVRHFADPTVGAVAGRIKVLSFGHTPWQQLLARWQSAEYNLGIGLTRMAQAAIGAIMIVPGACSAWRTDTVRGVGGVPLDTRAEDADLGFSLRWKGMRIVQDIEAVAYTEVPMTWKDLRKQQLRWCFGIWQVLYKHRAIMLHPSRFGPLAWLVMPYAIISTGVPAVVLPASYLLAGLAVINGNGRTVLVYWAVFTALRLVMSLAAMLILREWSFDPVIALCYRLLNDPLQIFLAYRTLFALATGTLVAWGKVPRVGEAMSLPPDSDTAKTAVQTPNSPLALAARR